MDKAKLTNRVDIRVDDRLKAWIKKVGSEQVRSILNSAMENDIASIQHAQSFDRTLYHYHDGRCRYCGYREPAKETD